MIIKIATNDDRPNIWSIIEPVIRAGETFAIPHNIGRGDALNYWLSNDKTAFVVEENNSLVGTFYLRSNQAGGGNHICNCGFITSPLASGKGIARKMCEYAIEYAKSEGYLGMQFNFVISTNHGAIALWQSMGFETVGRLPKAFNHPSEGFVDALIMYKLFNVSS